MEITGVEQVLGSKAMDPGRYGQVRLSIDKVEVTVASGMVLTAKIPGGKLKIIGGFTLEPGKTTILTLDFDADKSVVIAGPRNVLVKPVIKLLVRGKAEDRSEADQVGGTEPEAETATNSSTVAVTPAPSATPTAVPGPTRLPAPTPTPQEILTFEERVWNQRIEAALEPSTCTAAPTVEFPTSYYTGPLIDTHLHLPALPDWPLGEDELIEGTEPLLTALTQIHRCWPEPFNGARDKLRRASGVGCSPGTWVDSTLLCGAHVTNVTKTPGPM